MQRRLSIIKRICILLVVAALLSCKQKEPQQTAPVAPPSPRINIVLISVDTTRADALGVYGNREVDSHALDRLAESGAVFYRHLSHVPLTLPSHASMLTGLLPAKNAVHDNNGYRLSASAPTLASLLKQQGYNTAAFVSSVVLNHRFGIDRGFALYDDQFAVSKQTGQPLTERNAEETTGKAVSWLERSMRDPFFLFVHYYDPHAPYDPPQAYAARFKNPYLGEISFVDDQIENLLKVLEPVRQKTLIVVTSDHGEGLGEHDELGHGLFLYDSTLHVPLIVAGPSVQPGRKISGQTAMCDLLPTILEFAGINTPQGSDGRSLVPLLQGKPLPERPVISETFYPMEISWSPFFAIHSEGHKYIEAPHAEFYDLLKDPAEINNLLPAQIAAAQPLAGKIKQYRSVSLAGRKKESVNAELEEQLRSLGYVSGNSSASNPDALPDPKDKIAVWKLFEQATYLSMEGKNEQAAALAEKTLKLDPQNSVLYDAAGRYLFEADPSAAARMWQKALEIDPRNHTYHHKLAECLKKLGNSEKALQEEELALKIVPDMPEALLGAAGLMLQMNQPKEALRYLDALLRSDPRNVMALYQSGVAWRNQGEPVRAAEFFQKTINANPDLPYPYYDLAILKGQTGDWPSAENLLSHAISLNPDFAEAYYNLGVIYEKTGRNSEAIRAYSEFVSRAVDPRLSDRITAARNRIAALEQGS